MTKKRKVRTVAEFGDFQTPNALAAAATRIVATLGIRPQSILEPTCGEGSFVRAASEIFRDAEIIIGLDINQNHLDVAGCHTARDRRVRLIRSNFFTTQWESVLENNPSPWLIIGNPPWVTSAELGSLSSENLPRKSNFHGRAGIDAITGKSNFDISEWMLLRCLDWLEYRHGTLAVLCKTAVARKILIASWKRRYPVKAAYIYKIDAVAHFGAAVDACFFVLDTAEGASSTSCDLFLSLDDSSPARTIAYHDGHLVCDSVAFRRRRALLGPEQRYMWRSGIKHDSSNVMELAKTPTGYVNGFGESVNIESRFLYPLLKSSDIGNGRLICRSMMLVTQQKVGEDTHHIEGDAPRTWEYLQSHVPILGSRASSIYRNKPPFSIFGVGPYSFAPWKLAISGFYKRLRFVSVGPVEGRPVVFDDTIYFLPCASEDEARLLQELLTCEPATEFFCSMISWDEKRPITVDLLRRLCIRKVAAELGRESEYLAYTASLCGPLFTVRKRAVA